MISIVNNKDANRTQSFAYDALNRITSGSSAAASGALSWGENYSIDAWGNLQIARMLGKTAGGNFQCAGTVQNRASCLGYDAAGNLTNYTAPGQYVYDPENRISSTAGVTYTYDADGNRVLKTGGVTRSYWYANGNVIAEADGAGNLTAEYVYFNGRRAARIDLPAGSVHYYLSDHLGSTSMVVSAAGVVEEESDYMPFGAEVAITSGPNHYKFTGKERDSESQLDYFGARYYSSAMGRFISADPVNGHPWLLEKVMSNPANLNAYQYANNEPVGKTDLGGFLTIVVPGTFWREADWNSNSAFVQRVGKTTGETPVILRWNGHLSGSGRSSGATMLANMINSHRFAPGEKLTIVTHSHGGNVAFMASHHVNHKIDILIALGVPTRDDSMPDMSNISHLLEVWSPHDGWAPMGEVSLWNGATHALPGDGEEADEAISHSDLWRNPDVWNNHVVPHFNTWNNSGGGNGGGGGSAGSASGANSGGSGQTSTCKTKFANGPWHGC